MRCEWKTYLLGEITDFIDYRGKTPPKTTSGIPLVTAKIIKDNVIQEATEFIESSFYDAWMTRGIPQYGNVVFTTEAPLGEVAQIKTAEKLAFAQRVIILQGKKDYLDDAFLFYALQYEQNKERIKARSTGTTVFGIKSAELKKVEIDIPRIEIQLAIGSTLSAIDSKIANNTAINQHLEQMARAIFKSWFVDFEPWGGVMPEGWREGKLLDIADYLNGLAMQRFRPAEGEIGLPVLKIKELRQRNCDASSELCSPNIRSDYIVHDGDVIFSWSGSLLVDFWCGGDCGLNQHLFKVTSKKHDKWFYYAWTHHHLDQFIAMAADKATTMGHIKREALQNAEVLIPSEKDYAAIGEILSPLYEQVVSNRVESRKLAALRDTLLPRLMSGELSVADLCGKC